ncbi:MAG: hypothetical protein QOE77_1900 [Blastocatellia bacterium]|jgi:hypothetical protein|nr:hypothetical protein [Blastocatellia bacterium]
MNRKNFTTRLGGSLLGLIAAGGIGIAASYPVQAQYDEKDPNSESVAARTYREAELKKQFTRESHILDPSSPDGPFNNQLATLNVTNHTANEIRLISWVVTFTHPATGAVIKTSAITSKSRIAPGKQKTLKKVVRIPHLVDFKATHGRTWATLPTITTALASVTYADGTTSRTP